MRNKFSSLSCQQKFFYLVLSGFLLFSPKPNALSADGLTTGEVTKLLFKATPHTPVDLSHQNLSHLDLSGLDFKAARMLQSDVFGTDL
ncbi:MAG: hypothetical protein ACKOW3_06020, partial [Hyphomicrobium sp.]